MFGGLEELVVVHARQSANLALHQSHVTHGLNNIARTGLTLGANHRGTFGNTAQGLTQVLGATDKGHVELRLVDMVDVVGGREYLALVDVVNLDGLQDLCLGNVTDAALGHDGDGDSLLNAANHLRVAHTTHTTCSTDVGGDAFEGHDGTGTGSLGNPGLFGSRHVHDNTALQHLSQLAVQQCSFVHVFMIVCCCVGILLVIIPCAS